jgi:hypothetical protein
LQLAIASAVSQVRGCRPLSIVSPQCGPSSKLATAIALAIAVCVAALCLLLALATQILAKSMSADHPTWSGSFWLYVHVSQLHPCSAAVQADQPAAAVPQQQQQQQQTPEGNGTQQQTQQRKVGAAGPRTSSKEMVDTSPPRGERQNQTCLSQPKQYTLHEA